MLKTIIYSILIFTSTVFADSTGSFSFLSAGTGARALAMGGAFTALSDDASALYWNPAGLAKLNIYKTHFTGMFSNMEYGRLNGFVGVYEKMDNGAGSAGLSVHYFRVSGIEGRDALGAASGDIEYNAGALSVSYANTVLPGVQAGGTLKYYYAASLDAIGKGFGGDIGVLCKPFGPNFSAGFTVKDLNTGVSWNGGRTDYVKTLFVFGAAQSLIRERFIVSADLESDVSFIMRYRVGSEYLLNENLAFRIGLNHGSLTTGFGVTYQNYKIDYAFALDKYGFSDLHRFSFSSGF